MFKDPNLQEHLETSSTLNVESAVIAEWNMNISENIFRLGNYRYRPTESPQSAMAKYRTIPNDFDENDLGSFYTNATDADIVIDGGLEDDNETPAVFVSKKEKERLLYSLEDCLGKFRPRSGINKLRYFEGMFSHHSNSDLTKRPRFYMASKDDKFKYWTSYRTEGGLEQGIANKKVNNQFYINDAAPFVVYKEPVPANRIVIKMQTGVGSVNLGPFGTSFGSFEDPFFGLEKQRTPKRWKVQYLKNNIWTDSISFDENSLRLNGGPVVGLDGYAEISYGLKIPDDYINIFRYAGSVASEITLPLESRIGEAYLVGATESEVGVYHIWTGDDYETFVPSYGWYLSENEIDSRTAVVTEFVSPPKYYSTVDGEERYRNFEYIQGIRIVVESMNVYDSTFDLIEMSPRLVADLSDRTNSFSITKPASDLGVGGMPVGQLLASTGTISVFDFDQAFNKNNKDSIIAKYSSQSLQIKFFEVVKNVNTNGNFNSSFYIPIKSLYSDGFPELNATDRQVDLELRDLMFYFESTIAPEILIQSASVSYAVALLLDSVGFSNYVFKRNEDEPEVIIPYFFVGPDTSVAQALQDIAISTQTAMFFDEYNNFVMMSKGYIMPSVDERETDMTLFGSKDSISEDSYKNKTTKSQLANIEEIAYQPNAVYNDGKITYVSRYIQRSYSSIRQASMIDREKTWIYKPVLLWEVAGTESTKSINEEGTSQASYVLGAIPLNSDLTADLPQVSNHRVINNVMDLGEGVYWITRYNGYFYSNGEIIKYDAVQYSIPGAGRFNPETNQRENNVWISSVQEYQNYFSKIPFNGKIYPTGLVRIYSEPNYEVIDGITRMQNGPVAKHGRAQFGTEQVVHKAGLDSYWSNNQNVRGCSMDFNYLISGSDALDSDIGPAGISNSIAQKTTRNGIIKNFFSNSFAKESEANNLYSTQSGTVQSSALVMNGPSFATTEKPVDFISYVYKPLNKSFRHFGTRMRIVGKIENGIVRGQTPVGSTTYYTATSGASNVEVEDADGNSYSLTSNGPDQSINISGASGGLAVMVNPETNVGYYFEIAALTENNVQSYSSDANIFNIMFYKIKENVSSDYDTGGFVVDAVYSGNTLISKVSGQDLIINGTSSQLGDRVFVKDQAPNIEQNGYYVVTNVGGTFTDPETDVVTMEKWELTRDTRALPIRLWSGLSKIIVDNGIFTGQYRMTGEENPTVYDLAVEYENVGTRRRFFLYINNKLIATVDDENPLPIYNNMGLFVRGSSRVMFENIYALANNYSQNTGFAIDTPVNSAFQDNEIDVNEAFRKYSMSGMIQSTYLAGLSPMEPPKYNMYFEEFGTIMREAAYLNIKYDKAYPALYAKMSPTFNLLKGYTVSGFIAGSYGAEFLIFNSTDTAINLDETTGNYLRIQGITFTQASPQNLTVDDYFSKRGDFSNPQTVGSNLVISPIKEKREYQDIKNSRMTYGKREFTLDTPYIQTQDDANDLMSWIISKIMKPRLAVGVKIFGASTLQLGDIVNIDYQAESGVDQVLPLESRFVVYNIEYSNDGTGPSVTAYLSEVI
jgi:hypothetical protein